MDIGFYAPFVAGYADPAFMLRAAKAAEDLGFHSIWVPEHVLLFDEYESRYPYTGDGRLRIAEDGGVLGPLPFLSYLAAGTSRIRLGTGICLIPQRNPVYTAKDAATVDWLSGGRLDLGVGIGWLAEEFAALDVPWKQRAQRTNSYIKVIQSLWSDSISTYKDKYYDLPASRQNPKPIQKPHPPIHFGGESDPALERTAALGQGWFGYALTPEETVERMTVLKGMLAAHGRTIDEIYVSVAPNAPGIDEGVLERYAAAGVDQVILAGRGRNPDDYIERLGQMAKDVVEPARRMGTTSAVS